MAVWFSRINLLTLLLCFVVVVFGAYVRLSDAGLGCPDWPGCYGHVGVPETDHAVAAAEARYPHRPVEAHKAWKEMIHRYIASTLGFLIVLMAFLSLRHTRDSGLPRVLPWVLVGLVIFQGILGMWTVTWQLKPLAVTGHLLGGMSTFSLLLWMFLSVRARQMAADARPVVPTPRARTFAAIGLMLLVAQIFLGGWTSTNYAALACPDFPTCQSHYWPELDVSTAFTLWHGLGINYEYGILDNTARVTIHFFHRLGAIVVTTVMLLLGGWLLTRPEKQWKPYGVAVLAALLVQVSIGISVVILHLPLALAAAHNAGAAVLLGVLVALNHRAWWLRS